MAAPLAGENKQVCRKSRMNDTGSSNVMKDGMRCLYIADKVEP